MKEGSDHTGSGGLGGSMGHSSTLTGSVPNKGKGGAVHSYEVRDTHAHTHTHTNTSRSCTPTHADLASDARASVRVLASATHVLSAPAATGST